MHLGMMQQFLHRYQNEDDKQDCLKAVDETKTMMRKDGRKSNKLAKAELKEALEVINKLCEGFT